MQPQDNGQFGADEFAVAANVSRETLSRLKIYATMLEEWNARQNLVSRASLQQVWSRHFWDSAQLARFVPPEAESIVDLGSGAGFPGLILAELFRARELRVVLYEATEKKKEFLSAVAKRLNLAVKVCGERIEEARPEPFDVITARACAPLAKLLGYAQPFWTGRTVALFLKGQNVGPELTEAHKYWKMLVQKHPSRSSSTGVLLEIRGLRRVAPNRTTS